MSGMFRGFADLLDEMWQNRRHAFLIITHHAVTDGADGIAYFALLLAEQGVKPTGLC